MTPMQPERRPKPAAAGKKRAARGARVGGASLEQGLALAAKRIAAQRAGLGKRTSPPVRTVLVTVCGLAVATAAAVLWLVLRPSAPGTATAPRIEPEIERGHGWYLQAGVKAALPRVKELVWSRSVRPGPHKEVRTQRVHGNLRVLITEEEKTRGGDGEGRGVPPAVEEAAARHSGAPSRPEPYRKDALGRLIRPESEPRPR